MDMTLGERIRKARKGKMTQAELANLIGVHEITVRRWELGERLPDTDALKKLSQVLGISAGELMGEDDSVRKPNTLEIGMIPNMAYWGGVADNARNVAEYGNDEDIADVSHMLKRALASLSTPSSRSAVPV